MNVVKAINAMKPSISNSLIRALLVAVPLAVLVSLCGSLFADARRDLLSDDIARSGVYSKPATTEYYKLTFPPGPPIASIVWTTQQKGHAVSHFGNNKVLATGLVKVPKNYPLWLEFKYGALDHMDFIDQLAQCPVCSVNAAKLDFTDDNISHLKNFSHIVSLNLGETLVSDKSLPMIGAFGTLTYLCLSRTDITGTTFECLANLSKLTRLNLTGTALKIGCLAKLKPIFPNLVSLDVTGVGLTKEDGKTIQCLSKINSLDLTNNRQWDDNCAQYLLQLNKLQSLSIAGTKMTDRSLPALSKLPNLKTITVRPSSFWTPGLPRKVRAGLEIRDTASKSGAAPDLFEPLH
jgi:hypothetical protein